MAKTYNCPICKTAFTTALIKKNDKRCPGCSSKLKHTHSKVGGSMQHDWIVVHQEPKSKKPAEVAGPKYEKISPDDNPEIFRLIGPNPGREMDFQIIYWDKFAQTHLRCPVCNTYLHTTSTVSGGMEDVYCRHSIQYETENGEKEWRKCKARTRFIFLRRGQEHEINT